jgi:hypothetical protein
MSFSVAPMRFPRQIMLAIGPQEYLCLASKYSLFLVRKFRPSFMRLYHCHLGMLFGVLLSGFGEVWSIDRDTNHALQFQAILPHSPARPWAVQENEGHWPHGIGCAGQAFRENEPSRPWLPGQAAQTHESGSQSCQGPGRHVPKVERVESSRKRGQLPRSGFHGGGQLIGLPGTCFNILGLLCFRRGLLSSWMTILDPPYHRIIMSSPVGSSVPCELPPPEPPYAVYCKSCRAKRALSYRAARCACWGLLVIL